MMKIKVVAIEALSWIMSRLSLKSLLTVIIYFLVPLIVYLVYGRLVGSDIEVYEDSIPTTISGVIGTIMAIEFSMLLLVVERISSKYSPKFLHYILRDKVFFITVFCSIFTILFCLLPLQLHGINRSQVVLSAFSVSLMLFVSSLIETVHLMNLKESILNPEVKTIKKWIKKELCKVETAQLSNDYNSKACFIPDQFELELEEKMLPIRDIIVRSISDNNIQEATDGISAFSEVVLAYLYYRKNFLTDNDKFMFFIYSEYQNIASSALKTGYLHLRIHPILINSLGRISEEALKIKVTQFNYIGTNHLIEFPVKEIQNLCVQNLKYQNSSAPSIACRTLERIGVIALKEGYITESASIVKNLSNISNIALAISPPELYFLSQQSNISMMKIVIGITQNRDLLSGKQNSDYAIKSIIDFAISDTISKITQKKDIQFCFIDPLAPFMCELYGVKADVSKYNLANLVSNLLFSTDQPYHMNEGLEYIRTDIYSQIYRPMITKIGDTDGLRSTKFLDTLYLSQLALLSIFNKRLCCVLLGKEASNNLKPDKEKVIETFNIGLNILWKYFNGHGRQKYDHDYALDVIFSLMTISLADSNTDPDFSKNVKVKLCNIYQEYCSKDFTPQDTFFKYCRMINQFVKNATKERENILTNIPKYEEDSSSIYYSRLGDRSLPFEEHSEALFFERNDGNKQWKILGTYAIPNKYFDNLNDSVWGN